MLIHPDTFIRLIKNCPLDDTYHNTIYFNSVDDQTAYFRSTLSGRNFFKQSYQRYASGVLQVQASVDTLYDCNYLMFQNSAFGNKYFYAFVTSVEYVNNATTRVNYKIDVLQTWFFDYTLADCFVEREHPETDGIGDNLVPEGLETGEFLTTQLDVDNCPFDGGDYHVIIVYGTEKTAVNGEYAAVVGNVFSGLDFIRCVTPSSAYAKLKEINDAGKSDAVVGVFMIPSMFWGGQSVVDFTATTVIGNVSKGLDNLYNNTFNGYKPKNNKLYTGQFFGLIGTSSSGDEHRYPIEYFQNPTAPHFGLYFGLGASPEAMLAPMDYKGTRANYNEELTCKDFPQCAYATDSFKAYLAQNSGRLLAGAATTALSTAVQAVSNPGGAALNAFNAVFNTLGTLHDISVLPPKIRGAGASYVNYTRNSVGFRFYLYNVTKEFAQIIDGYFDMFGYAVHRVKKPNRNSRPHWNYVKTSHCAIHGNAPSADLSAIEQIYDNGVTFWKNGAEIGNYSLDNSPQEV